MYNDNNTANFFMSLEGINNTTLSPDPEKNDIKYLQVALGYAGLLAICLIICICSKNSKANDDDYNDGLDGFDALD